MSDELKKKGVLEAYDALLSSDPIRTKVITAALIGASSDVISAKLCGLKADPGTASRQAIVQGVVITPLVHTWFALMEKMFAGWSNSLTTSIVKSCVQLSVLEPFLQVAWMGSNGVLAGEDMDTIWATIRGNFWNNWSMAWRVWGPAAIINYKLIPVRWRTVFGNVVGFLWTIWLIVSSRKKKKEVVKEADKVD